MPTSTPSKPLTSLATFLLLSLAMWVLPSAAEDAQDVEKSREQRLQFMKEMATEFTLFEVEGSGVPLPLMQDPIRRYTNPEADVTDGVTFLWLNGMRPAAAVSYSIRLPDNRVYREWTSLSSMPLDCQRAGATIWSPKAGGLLRQPLEQAPAPGTTQLQRLTQMKSIARRFSGARYAASNDSPTVLRLTSQPLYRFSAEERGVLDGGLFVFVIANDPELFLLLEAVRDDTTSQFRWQYSLARMSSSELTIRLDDKQIWSIPNYYRDAEQRGPTAAYGESRLGRFIPTNTHER